MILIPAIDLYQGRCVRLFQGSFEQVTYYDVDPVTLARRYAMAGASWLHLVNLDGAKDGVAQDSAVLQSLCQIRDLKVQCGGGIRDANGIAHTLQSGVSRVVIGSLVLTDPALLKQGFHDYGADRITLALDVRLNNGEPMIASHGWKKQSTTPLWHVLEEFSKVGLKDVLCTDISKDGAMAGPNVELYSECVTRFPDIEFQASGGVRHAADLHALSGTGVAAAIVGRALYEDDRLLEEARPFLPNA